MSSISGFETALTSNPSFFYEVLYLVPICQHNELCANSLVGIDLLVVLEQKFYNQARKLTKIVFARNKR